MKTRFAYGPRSLAALGVLLLGTQDFHPQVLLAVDVGQTAAWLAVIFATLFAVLAVWPVGAMLRRLPDAGLMDVVYLAVGRPGAILYSLLLAGTLMFMAGMLLRETSEMALSAMFPHTPQTFAITALMLGAVYLAFGQGSDLVRFGQLLLVPLLAALALVIAGSMGWGEIRYLTPLLGPGLLPLATSVPSVAMIFGPLAVVLMLAAGVRDRQNLSRWLVATPLISGAMYTVTKINLLMVFAYPVGVDITFPLHQAARLVMGGRFFERLEGLWLLVWVLGTIALLGALLYASALAFAQAWGLPRHRTAVPPLAAVCLTIAFFPPDQASTVLWHEGASVWITTVTLLVPAALAGVAALRKGRLSHAP